MKCIVHGSKNKYYTFFIVKLTYISFPTPLQSNLNVIVIFKIILSISYSWFEHNINCMLQVMITVSCDVTRYFNQLLGLA